MTLTVTLQEGIAALEQGRFPDAESIFRQILENPDNLEQCATMLLFALIWQNKVDDVHALVEHSEHWQHYQGALYDALMHYAKQNRFDVIITLSKQLEPRHVFLRAIIEFITGCAKAGSGDTNLAAPHFQNAYSITHTCETPIPLAENLEHLIKAGWNIEDDAFVAQVMGDKALNAKKAGLLIDHNILPTSGRPAGKEDFVIYSACDEKYLDAYVEAEVLSLDALGQARIFHLNIIGKSETCAGKVDAIRARLKHVTLNYTIEQKPQPHSTTYLACSRFVNALSIMDMYDQGLLISDVDIVFFEDVNRIASFMQAHDVGCMFFENTLPWLRHIAAGVYVKNNPEGRNYLTALGNYCLKKLEDHRYWTLDQTAMYCIANAFNRMGHKLSIFDLRAHGVHLYEIQPQMDARLVRNQTRFQ